MSDGQDPSGAPVADASATPDPAATTIPAATAGTAGRWVLPTRRLLWWEIIAVFGVSLGGSGLYAFVSLIGSLTASKSLGEQTTKLNRSPPPPAGPPSTGSSSSPTPCSAWPRWCWRCT